MTRRAGRWHPSMGKPRQAGGVSSHNDLGAEPHGDLDARVRAAGLGAGLSDIGVASAEILEPARSVLHRRKSAGLAGEMQFTYRNPDRSTDPARILPSAASIVVGALSYQRQPPRRDREQQVDPSHPVGRVAMYAWRDHYDALRQSLTVVADLLRDEGYQARVHLDDNNLVDRNVAYAAGLGWYGKNANLLLPGQGSWFVLGSVVTDAPLTPGAPLADGCGPCTRCLDDCPTAAIVAPGVVDARRCIAWLVQGPGPIPVEFRRAVGNRIYGCDDCQEVCPPNRTQRPSAAEAEPDAESLVDLHWILHATDDALLERHGRWYIAGRDPNVIRRTAVIALGNTGDPADPEVRHLLAHCLGHVSPLVRSHAVWAARELQMTDLLSFVEADPHPLVVEELALR